MDILDVLKSTPNGRNRLSELANIRTQGIKMHTVSGLKECQREFHATCHDGTDYDTLNVTQNTEVGDHYRVSLFLERWRTASELVEYLRWAAQQVEELAKSQKPEGK